MRIDAELVMKVREECVLLNKRVFELETVNKELSEKLNRDCDRQNTMIQELNQTIANLEGDNNLLKKKLNLKISKLQDETISELKQENEELKEKLEYFAFFCKNCTYYKHKFNNERIEKVKGETDDKYEYELTKSNKLYKKENIDNKNSKNDDDITFTYEYKYHKNHQRYLGLFMKHNIYDRNDKDMITMNFWNHLDDNGSGFGYEFHIDENDATRIRLEWGMYKEYDFVKGVNIDLFRPNDFDDDIDTHDCSIKCGRFTKYKRIEGRYTHIFLNTQTTECILSNKISNVFDSNPFNNYLSPFGEISDFYKNLEVSISLNMEDNTYKYHVINKPSRFNCIIVDEEGEVKKYISDADDEYITIYPNNHIAKFLAKGKQIEICPDNVIIKYLLPLVNKCIKIYPDDVVTKFVSDNEQITIFQHDFITKYIANDKRIDIHPDNVIIKYISLLNKKSIEIHQDDHITKTDLIKKKCRSYD